MFRPKATTLMVCVVFTALFTTAMLAQTTPGKIAGTVRDPSGVPVVGAAVELKNQQTGAARVLRSSAAGAYEFADLQPGIYLVHADMPGFRRASKVASLSSGTVTVDLVLELNVAEDVTVTAMKREETVFSTPISVAAPTEQDLRDHGISNIEEVAANVADFTVQNLGPGQSTVAMRGVSSGQIARDQPGSRSRWAPTWTSRSSPSPCSRRTSTSST